MKQLELKDYKIIKPYLDLASYEGVNSNFVTLMMWSHDYNTYYEIVNDSLILLLEYKNNKYFAMPYCTEDKIIESIKYMLSYAKEHNFPFKIEYVIDSIKNIIKKEFTNYFIYIDDRNSYDYVYRRDDLASLSGKRNQKRRNHFNAFIKENPDYIYKEIENEDIDKVFSCLNKWNNNHNASFSTKSEYIAIMYLLFHKNELDIKTGCIYINGQLEAFTIGSKMANNTIDIHVEKANPEIRGLYVAIGKFFLENNYLDAEFINREDDMGIASLRKAKENLHPVKMISKTSIVEANLEIRGAKNNDLSLIRDLWLESFEDEDKESTDYYFKNLFNINDTYVITHCSYLVGALQIVPYRIMLEKQERLAYFILGVCVKKNYQHNHIMKKLLSTVLEMDQYKDKLCLLQAYNPKIYESFDFYERYLQKKIKIDTNYYASITSSLNISSNYSSKNLVNLYKSYTKYLNGSRIRDEEYYQKYILSRLSIFNEKIILISDFNKNIAYCLYNQEEDVIKINEFIYDKNSNLETIISKITNYFANKKIIITTDITANIIGDVEIVSNMLTNFEINKDISFINECY